jgi:antitoxin PrlF
VTGWGMTKPNEKASCSDGHEKTASCCRVESLITIDERGQMVLPKDLRDKENIKVGEKLALITWEKDGEICCLTMIKANDLAHGVKEFLGPFMKDMV